MTTQEKPSRANVVRRRHTLQIPQERTRERSKTTSYTRETSKRRGQAGTKPTSRNLPASLPSRVGLPAR